MDWRIHWVHRRGLMRLTITNTIGISMVEGMLDLKERKMVVNQRSYQCLAPTSLEHQLKPTSTFNFIIIQALRKKLRLPRLNLFHLIRKMLVLNNCETILLSSMCKCKVRIRAKLIWNPIHQRRNKVMVRKSKLLNKFLLWSQDATTKY